MSKTATFQLLVRGIDGRTSCLKLTSDAVTGSSLEEQIADHLRIPSKAFFIVTGARLISSASSLRASSDGWFPSCNLHLRLRGGKGGFGSLLRGAATKAGQKKTSNFDACRDMSGRRLRHVNAEKKLKEWKAQAQERELEKTANEFLKKQMKKKTEDAGCSKEIEEYREATFKAMEDVESAVAEGLAEAKKLGKRKVMYDDDEPALPSNASKRAQVWFLSEDVVEEGSEDEDDEIENAEVHSGEAAESEKDVVLFAEDQAESKLKDVDLIESHTQPEDGNSQKESKVEFNETNMEGDGGMSNDPQSYQDADTVKETNKSYHDENEDLELNFDNIKCASDLEVLGMERLKCQLQSRGLKCGGSLYERAGRLFLLKTTSLEKLDKKYFAKSK